MASPRLAACRAHVRSMPELVALHQFRASPLDEIPASIGLSLLECKVRQSAQGNNRRCSTLSFGRFRSARVFVSMLRGATGERRGNKYPLDLDNTAGYMERQMETIRPPYSRVLFDL